MRENTNVKDGAPYDMARHVWDPISARRFLRNKTIKQSEECELKVEDNCHSILLAFHEEIRYKQTNNLAVLNKRWFIIQFVASSIIGLTGIAYSYLATTNQPKGAPRFERIADRAPELGRFLLQANKHSR